MKTLLQIHSSLFEQEGQSSRLGNTLAAQLLGPEDRLISRDLASNPVPHLTAERFAAYGTPRENRSPEQQALAADADAMIAELHEADVIIFGVPMYNFGIPSTLKAYFDHVARAGETFRYTSSGAEGLLTGKKAYVVTTRGGQLRDTAMDTLVPYMKIFLDFVGIKDVEYIYVEGLARGGEIREQALRDANNSIYEVAA